MARVIPLICGSSDPEPVKATARASYKPVCAYCLQGAERGLVRWYEVIDGGVWAHADCLGGRSQNEDLNAAAAASDENPTVVLCSICGKDFATIEDDAGQPYCCERCFTALTGDTAPKAKAAAANASTTRRPRISLKNENGKLTLTARPAKSGKSAKTVLPAVATAAVAATAPKPKRIIPLICG